MLQFWMLVFWDSIKDSLEFIGKEPSDLAVSIAVFLVVGIILVRRQGRKGVTAMKERLVKALGEDIKIIAVIFCALVVWHIGKNGYERWLKADERANRAEKQVKQLTAQISTNKPDLHFSLAQAFVGPLRNTPMFIVDGIIVNRGAPGAVVAWRARYESPSISKDIRLGVTYGTLKIKATNASGEEVLSPDNYLPTKASSPIPTNGVVAGKIAVFLPDESLKDINNAVITIWITDAQGNSVAAHWKGSPANRIEVPLPEH